jgi:Golgi phosphoprotein 3
VVDERQTGETILDETLKLVKGQGEKLGINSWIDLLSGTSPVHLSPFQPLTWLCLSRAHQSGETWNVMKIGFQLKQVRERLAKGLVDKGVLRTEKRNFLLFDMATHPVADVRTKEAIVSRVTSLLSSSTSSIPSSALDEEGTQCRVMRAVCLACASYAASVLDNAFVRLPYEERELALQRCDDILTAFACWPLGSAGGTGAKTGSRRREGTQRIGIGSGETSGRESVLGLVQEARKEMVDGDDDVCFELVAGVLEVLSKLDSLL